MISSVEVASRGVTRTRSGVWKELEEPVVVTLGGELSQGGTHFVCRLLFCHAGLKPGEYEMENGLTVRITPDLVGSDARMHQEAELEVVQ